MASQETPEAGRVSGAGEVVFEDYIYKACKKKDLVVGRFLSLYQDKFYTYHNYQEDKDNRRSWEFSRHCKLEPKKVEDIEEEEKTIRPPGKSTLKTIAAGGGKKVKLYCFSVYWPTSWATKGYTSFTVGCEARDSAVQWHTKFMAQINYVKFVRTQQLRSHNRSSSKDSDASIDCHDLIHSAPLHKVTRLSSNNSMPEVPLYDAADAPDSLGSHGSLPNPEPTSSPLRTSFEIPAVGASRDPTRPPLPPAQRSGAGAGAGLSNAERTAAMERWVPFKHVNGVAIYYNHSKGEDGMGPEYMASCVVRGTPKACLDVLMKPGCHTTLLGPASGIRVLKENEEEGYQVLRMRVDAPGFAGRICAPREVVVKSMYKKDDESIHALMFATVDDAEFTQSSPGNMDFVNLRPSYWKTPVKAHVQGGYTIAPLQGKGDESEESLITCILNVELGGWCSKKSWLQPFSEVFGLADAYVERMLMGVILLKDMVEHQRFQAHPFAIMAPDTINRPCHTDQELLDTKAPPTIVTNASQDGQLDGGRGMSRMASKLYMQRSDDSPCSSKGGGFSNSPNSLRNSALFHSATSVPLDALTEGSSLEGESPRTPLCRIPSSTLDPMYWEEIHRAGQPAPFKVRGANYLKDRKKVEGGEPVFTLGAVDLVALDGPTQHIARYLPSIRRSKAPFAFVVQLIVPGTPMLALVVTLITEHHPDELGPPPGHPDHSGDWKPFDHLLYKFLNTTDDERNAIFKLIPHLAEGSWVIKQSVGTTPVILGKKLKTTYHFTKRYVEVDVDISANATATYVVSMVRGALKSLVVEMGFVLEGQAAVELPEVLVGAVRFNNMDLGKAVRIDTSKEIPMDDL